MTREGIKKCVRLLQLTFPNTYRSFTSDDLSMLIEVWSLQFRNVDDVQVFSAVNSVISMSDYPPTIAEIKRQLIGEHEENEEEVWYDLLEAGSNGIYGAEEEWEKLPESIKAITTPWTLREIALADSSSLRFIKKEIMESYRSYKKRKADMLLSTSFTDQKLLEGK